MACKSLKMRLSLLVRSYKTPKDLFDLRLRLQETERSHQMQIPMQSSSLRMQILMRSPSLSPQKHQIRYGMNIRTRNLEESAARSLPPQVPERHPAQMQRRSISRQSSGKLERQGTLQEPQGSVLLDNAPQKPMTPPSDVSNRDRDAMPTSVLSYPASRNKSSSVSTNGASNRLKKVHKDIYEPVGTDIEDSQMSPNSSRKAKARRSTSGEASRKKLVKSPITKKPGKLPLTAISGQTANVTRHRAEPINYLPDQYEVKSDKHDLTYHQTEDERPREISQRLPRYSHPVDSTTQMGSWRHTPSNQLEQRAEPRDLELPDVEPTLPAPAMNRSMEKVAEQSVSVEIPAIAKQATPVIHDVQNATPAPDNAATSENTKSETLEIGMTAGNRVESRPTHLKQIKNAVIQRTHPATPQRKRKRKAHLIENETLGPASHQGSPAPGLPQRDASYLEMPRGNPSGGSATISSSNSSSGAQLEHDLEASTQDSATKQDHQYHRSKAGEQTIPAVEDLETEIHQGVVEDVHAWGIMVCLTSMTGNPLGLVPAKAVQDDGEWTKSSSRFTLGKLVNVRILKIQNKKINLTMQGVEQPIEVDEEEIEPTQGERNVTPLQKVGKSTKANPLRWLPQSDKILMQARHEGLGWVEIQRQHFPNRTADSCRVRHKYLQQKASRGSTEAHRRVSKTSPDVRPPEDVEAKDIDSIENVIERDIGQLPIADETEARMGLGITDTPPKPRKSTSSAVEPVPLDLSAATRVLQEKSRATSASSVRVDDSSRQSSMSHEQINKLHPRTNSKPDLYAIQVNRESTDSSQRNEQGPSARAIPPSRKNRERKRDHGEAGQNPILPPGLTHDEYQKRRSEKEREIAKTQAPDNIQYTRNDPSEQKPSTFTTKKPKTQSGRDADGASTIRDRASTKSTNMRGKPTDKGQSLKSVINEHAASPAPQVSLANSTNRKVEQDASSSSNEQASMPRPHQKSLPTPKPSPILPNSTVIREAPTVPQPAPTKKPTPSTTLLLARAASGKLKHPSKSKPSKPLTLMDLHNVRRAEVAAAKARSNELQPNSSTPIGNSAKSTALPSLGSDDDDDDDTSSSSGSDASSESEDRSKGKATKVSQKVQSKPALRDRDMSVEVDTDIDTDDEGSIAA